MPPKPQQIVTVEDYDLESPSPADAIGGGGIEDITDVDIEGPPPTSTLRAQHQQNVAAEAKAYERAKSGTELTAAGVRGFGGMAGMIPLIGPGISGLSDIAAQGIEIAGGQRQHFNPLRTAAEVAPSFIPGLPLAKAIAPIAPTIGKFGTKAAIAGGRALEGAARGAGVAAATPLADLELPTAGQIATGAAAGAVFSPLASISEIRKFNYLKPGRVSAAHIAKAINLPEAKAGGAANLEEGVGLALTHAQHTRGPKSVNSMADLSDVSKEAVDTFGKAHIDPYKQNFGSAIINAKPVLNEATKNLTQIHKTAEPGVQKAIDEADKILGQPQTANDLLEYYHIVADKIRPFEKANPADRAKMYGDAEWRTMVKLKSGLQNMLADYFDGARALQEGTSVAKLRSSGNGFRGIHRQYGSLRFLADSAKDANERLMNARLKEEGELAGVGTVGRMVRSLTSPRRAVATAGGEIAETAIGGRNDPDRLVKRAANVFRRYGTQAQMPKTQQLSAAGAPIVRAGSQIPLAPPPPSQTPVITAQQMQRPYPPSPLIAAAAQGPPATPTQQAIPFGGTTTIAPPTPAMTQGPTPTRFQPLPGPPAPQQPIFPGSEPIPPIQPTKPITGLNPQFQTGTAPLRESMGGQIPIPAGQPKPRIRARAVPVQPVEPSPPPAAGPIEAYHGTGAKFEEFQAGKGIGPHFGTKEQANVFATEAAEQGLPGHVRKVSLDIKNPLKVDFDSGWENPALLATNLEKAGVLSKGEGSKIGADLFDKKITDEQAFSMIRDKITSKGYDAIAYPNKFEGQGTSYIPLNKQVLAAAKTTGRQGVPRGTQPVPSIVAAQTGQHPGLRYIGEEVLPNGTVADKYAIPMTNDLGTFESHFYLEPGQSLTDKLDEVLGRVKRPKVQ